MTMPSTLMQTVEQGIADPTVIYDSKAMTITSSVIVTLAEGAKDVTIMAAPVTVPRDTWTLIWNLVVDTPGLTAVFAGPGIILLPPLPPKVAVVEWPSAVTPTRSTATLGNAVLGTNAFNYDIAVDWSFSVSPSMGTFPLEPLTVQTTVHDPTIVVTKDPIG
jgi:hypothetical protein